MPPLASVKEGDGSSIKLPVRRQERRNNISARASQSMSFAKSVM